MRNLCMAVIIGGCFVSCVTTTPHPKPDRPIAGCYLTCPDGWFMRPQHRCRGSMWMQDIQITGEDDVPGDPAESRWFTGLTSFGADYMVNERLKAAGITRADPRWREKYSELLAQVTRELGREAKAAYPKLDVVLMSCDALKAMRCMASGQCAHHPGEPDPLHPDDGH